MSDPGFQALTIRANGRASQLITELSVSAPYDEAAPPDPLPHRIRTRALWDTGASKSVISQQLAKDLHLVPTGATNIIHAGGRSISPTHVVHFYLPHGVTIAGVLVTEFAGTPSFAGIIGMDVITLGDFSITNVAAKTCMSFRTPSRSTIDYVTEHNHALYAGVGRNDPCPCGSGNKFKRCHGR